MSSSFRALRADNKQHQAEKSNAGRDANAKVQRALKYN